PRAHNIPHRPSSTFNHPSESYFRSPSLSRPDVLRVINLARSSPLLVADPLLPTRKRWSGENFYLQRSWAWATVCSGPVVRTPFQNHLGSSGAISNSLTRLVHHCAKQQQVQA